MRLKVIIALLLSVLLLCGCGRKEELNANTTIVRADTVEDEIKPEIPSNALEIEKENLLALEQPTPTPAQEQSEEKSAPVSETFELKISRGNIDSELESALAKTIGKADKMDDSAYIYTLDFEGKEALKKTLSADLKAYVDSISEEGSAIEEINVNEDFSRFVLTVKRADWTEELQSKTVESLNRVWKIYNENFSESAGAEIVILDEGYSLVNDIKIGEANG